MGLMLSLLKLEQSMKGAASRRRIAILLLLEKRPGISLLDVAEISKRNLKTTAVHVQRLAAAGLIIKGRRTGTVPLRLTARGQEILKFLKKLD